MKKKTKILLSSLAIIGVASLIIPVVSCTSTVGNYSVSINQKGVYYQIIQDNNIITDTTLLKPLPAINTIQKPSTAYMYFYNNANTQTPDHIYYFTQNTETQDATYIGITINNVYYCVYDVPAKQSYIIQFTN